ncbi:MAG: EAL domain-containing protein [Leptolyngbya sp. SIOISBB]|nr:EAL domain-containing protein [Leptolyngbya sp. SIOISBB]
MPQKVALLIGVSDYKENLDSLPAAAQDIEVLKEVLENPKMGEFDQVKLLCNPDSLEMQYGIETFFMECEKEDLILLFFSGHGLKDDRNNLHFATTNTKKNSRGDLILSTVVSASFVNQVMSRCRARRQVIILDCCFSGAFRTSLQSKDDSSLGLREQLGAEGRVVLASSSSTQYSFEHKESELSIYTKHLIEAFESVTSDANQDGYLSIYELHEYATQRVQEEYDDITPKIIVLKDEGYNIILSKAQVIDSSIKNAKTIEESFSTGKIRVKIPQFKDETSNRYKAIPSSLEYLEPFIEKLIENLRNRYFSTNHFENTSENEKFNNIMEFIRISSDADFVALVQFCDDQSGWLSRFQSSFSDKIHGTYDPSIYLESVVKEILTSASLDEIFTTGYRGVYRSYRHEETENHQLFALIPLAPCDELFGNDAGFIVVCGLPEKSKIISDAYTRVITSFYQASRRFPFSPSIVEAEILDNLKQDYGFVPLNFYEKRFDIFCERLSQIEMYFEPILDLDTITISGWEALARDPNTLSAPVDLFKAAELWGKRFTIELDIVLLESAVRTYYYEIVNDYHDNGSHNFLMKKILPLSVNVYPQSLVQDVYYKTVKRLTSIPEESTFMSDGSYFIPGRKLILEISEKTELPSFEKGIRLQNPLESFKNKLSKYSRDLKVKFGIDDFGVGHASMSRLAGLSPPYVKVDREMLHHRPAEIIIKFLHDLVAFASPLNPALIILEGLDEKSPINLRQLRELEVSYVQGHIIGKAGPQIYDLSPEKRKFLEDKIQG